MTISLQEQISWVQREIDFITRLTKIDPKGNNEARKHALAIKTSILQSLKVFEMMTE